MPTNFQRLECSTGCCLDKVKHLAEQIFHTQDDAYNNLAAENIELGNFVVDDVLPYLEARAVSGDYAAQDLIISINHVLRA